jgi:hypothetical protein
MVIVAVKDWIIDQLNFLIFSKIKLFLFLLSVLLFPHGWGVGSFPFAHVLIHQPVSEPVIRLSADLFKLFSRTPPVQRVAYGLVYHLGLLRRTNELLLSIHMLLFVG